MIDFKRIDTAIRRKLCAKFGHKFYVGSSGYYCGMAQNRCWRCGKIENTDENRRRKMPDYAEPLGRWFS